MGFLEQGDTSDHRSKTRSQCSTANGTGSWKTVSWFASRLGTSDEILLRGKVPRKEASAMPNLDILKRRIARVAARVIPGCQVVFEATPFAWVRFRIEDRSGQTIAGPSADFHAEEIADWTDQELRDVLTALTRFPQTES
jgi:hypothetical protein